MIVALPGMAAVPRLEYYYIYPHLGKGALLVIDDTQIPSGRMLIEFLVMDAMF